HAVVNKNTDHDGVVNPITIEDTYYLLEAAQTVLFVPGFGMAIAQAQHVVKELSDLLIKNGTQVKFAIHPVAGRMPGHMNVLLAEADVPYDLLIEPEEANAAIPLIDVCVVVGANDTVNLAARDQKDCPIYGMPII